MRRQWVIACLAGWLMSVWLAEPAAATGVVALRRGDTLLVGADSLQALTIGGSRSVCKIAQGEGCFFAVIGHVWDPNHDLYQLGRTACASAPHVEDKTTNFLAALREPFAEDVHVGGAARAGQRRQDADGRRDRSSCPSSSRLTTGRAISRRRSTVSSTRVTGGGNC